jgi:hypothetical protein
LILSKIGRRIVLVLTRTLPLRERKALTLENKVSPLKLIIKEQLEKRKISILIIKLPMKKRL